MVLLTVHRIVRKPGMRKLWNIFTSSLINNYIRFIRWTRFSTLTCIHVLCPSIEVYKNGNNALTCIHVLWRHNNIMAKNHSKHLVYPSNISYFYITIYILPLNLLIHLSIVLSSHQFLSIQMLTYDSRLSYINETQCSGFSLALFWPLQFPNSMVYFKRTFSFHFRWSASLFVHISCDVLQHFFSKCVCFWL